MSIPLRVLRAAQPELVRPRMQVLQRAVTLIQRFGSAAGLNIHLHCLVLDGAYRCDADGAPKLKTPWRDGTTHSGMSPLGLMRRTRS